MDLQRAGRPSLRRDGAAVSVYRMEETRAAAQRRIHEDEMARLECILVAYEIDKANARLQVYEFCKQFGHALVGEWVHQHYEAEKKS